MSRTDEPVDVAAALNALRARSPQGVSPVRMRFMEALARRAAGQQGPVRRVLDERLAMWIAACGNSVVVPADAAGAADAAPRVGPGPLGQLVSEMAQRAASAGDPASPPTAAGASSPSPELKALAHFRSTWARLAAEQRLAQSRALVPGNAGPLNSHQLVYQSLILMRELSPGYLDHFMAHVDTLLWLDANRRT